MEAEKAKHDAYIEKLAKGEIEEPMSIYQPEPEGE